MQLSHAETGRVEGARARRRDPQHPRLHRFEAMYRQEFAFVWAVARRLGVPAAAVDDAVQDVFVTAYRRLDELHYEVSPRAWLYGVTRRVAFRYRRTAARQARRTAALVAIAPRCSEAPQKQHEHAEQVDRFLARLGEGTRQTFVMAELLGMNGPEIASELGVPLNTVYSRLRLARRKLSTMTTDDAQAEAWMSAERQVDRPLSGSAKRTWAFMLPILHKGSTATGWGLLAGGFKAKALAVVIGAGVGVVAAFGIAPRVAAMSDTPAVEDEGPTDSQPKSLVGSDVETREADETPEQHTVLSPPPMPPPVAGVEQAGHAPRERRASAAVGERPKQPTQSSVDTLAQEVALLDAATARLAENDPSGALELLTQHERRFANSRLTDARMAARVRALCAQGNAVQARAEAQRLIRAYPTSAVAQGAQKICVEQ